MRVLVVEDERDGFFRANAEALDLVILDLIHTIRGLGFVLKEGEP